MSDRDDHVKLSPKMRFCLMAFSGGTELTTFDVARKAEQEGINRTSCRFEWADAPMRALRAAGLLEYAAGTDGLGRRFHRLTDRGRMAVAVAGG